MRRVVIPLAVILVASVVYLATAEAPSTYNSAQVEVDLDRYYDSLADLAQDADVIALGRFTDNTLVFPLSPEDPSDPQRIQLREFVPTRILKGTP